MRKHTEEKQRTAMTDIERMCDDLEKFKLTFQPFVGAHQDWKKVNRVITYLRSQEPVLLENQRHRHDVAYAPLIADCPRCGGVLEGKQSTRFCRFCGQAVKWVESKKKENSNDSL